MLRLPEWLALERASPPLLDVACFNPCTGAEERATESWCSPSLLLAKTTNKLRLLVAIQFDGVFASRVIPQIGSKLKS